MDRIAFTRLFWPVVCRIKSLFNLLNVVSLIKWHYKIAIKISFSNKHLLTIIEYYTSYKNMKIMIILFWASVHVTIVKCGCVCSAVVHSVWACNLTWMLRTSFLFAVVADHRFERSPNAIYNLCSFSLRIATLNYPNSNRTCWS